VLVEALNPNHGVAPWSNPGDPVIRLDPGQKAATSVVWSNWCGAQPSGTLTLWLRLVTGMIAVKPDATQPDLAVPPCNGTEPSSLSTIAFYAP